MRTTFSIKNSAMQFITNISSIILTFVGRILFIKILGVEYSGLNGLFTNILTVLNLFELGISSSITFNLYKYVKNDDKDTIKSIMYFYKKAYRYIAILILFVGLLITPLIKYTIKDISIDINIYLIFILFLLSTVSSYILSYKRNLIIANQKNYIINLVEIVFILILNVLQIIVLFLTKNFYLYLVIKILCVLLENFVINHISNKLYPFLLDKNIEPLNDDIKENIVSRIKTLIIHKTSGAVTNGTDNILISSFLGIVTAGLFTSYNYIVTSVKRLFSNVISAVTPSIGNLLVENNCDKNYMIYKRIVLFNFWIAVFTSTSLLLITQPFIKIWLGKDYLLDITVLISIVANYYQTMMRSTYNSFKEAAGIWIEDKYVPLAQLSINLISSIILLKTIGLPGVFIGTIISSFVVWFYSYPILVYKKLFNRRVINYYKEIFLYLLLFILIISLSFVINLFLSNIFFSIMISLIVPNFLLYIFFKNTDEFKYYFNLIKRNINR